MIFSAHSHYSRVITYPPQNIESLVDNRIVTIHLNGVRDYTEIAVPTSSYRMGVTNIGYGYAVIGKYYLVLNSAMHVIFRSKMNLSYFYCIFHIFNYPSTFFDGICFFEEK